MRRLVGEERKTVVCEYKEWREKVKKIVEPRNIESKVK